jgi:hypothetical protein
MDLVYIYGKMVENISVNIIMELNMVTVNIIGQMEKYLKVNGKMAIGVKEFL